VDLIVGELVNGWIDLRRCLLVILIYDWQGLLMYI